jgi:oligoendopeptidase F
MQAPDPATRGQIWTEVSKRYKEYPHVTAQAITQATRRNSERLAGQPKFANVYNKQTQRTERVRIQ